MFEYYAIGCRALETVRRTSQLSWAKRVTLDFSNSRQRSEVTSDAATLFVNMSSTLPKKVFASTRAEILIPAHHLEGAFKQARKGVSHEPLSGI